MLNDLAQLIDAVVRLVERLPEHVALEAHWLQSAVLAAFAVVNSVRIFAYVPQILKAARDRHGAVAISNTTWGLFFASHTTTILYALVSLGDALMALIFLGNALACALIVGITVWKRRAHRLRQARAQP